MWSAYIVYNSYGIAVTAIRCESDAQIKLFEHCHERTWVFEKSSMIRTLSSRAHWLSLFSSRYFLFEFFRSAHSKPLTLHPDNHRPHIVESRRLNLGISSHKVLPDYLLINKIKFKVRNHILINEN